MADQTFQSVDCADALAPGSRHRNKDEIYSFVSLLHRKYNMERDPNATDEYIFYARKSDKAKLLLRCGHRESSCPFRIKARLSKKPDHADAQWLITIGDLKHTCGDLGGQNASNPENLGVAGNEVLAMEPHISGGSTGIVNDDPNESERPLKKRKAVAGTRMKTAYLNNVIVKQAVSILQEMEDPFEATADDLLKKIAPLDPDGKPNMSLSTMRRVLVEALLQVGVSNHEDFSSLPSFAARINAIDADSSAMLQGMTHDIHFLKGLLLLRDFEFDESQGQVIDLVNRQFSGSAAANDTFTSTKALLEGSIPLQQDMLDMRLHSLAHGGQALLPPPNPFFLKSNHLQNQQKQLITQVASLSFEDLKAKSAPNPNQYLYFRSFFTPGQCVRATTSLRQHVLSIHAEPCVGKYRGCLFSAMTLAPDGGSIPLAFGHCLAENVQNWIFFLRGMLESFPEFVGAPDLVVISTFETCIDTAVKAVLPNAHHAVCLTSMIERLLLSGDEQPMNMQQLDEARDLVSNTTKSALKIFFLPCALATSIQDHEMALKLMENNSPATANACRRYPISAWSLARICTDGRSNFGQLMLLQKRPSRRNGPSYYTNHGIDSLLDYDRDLATVAFDSSYDLVEWQDLISRQSKMPVPRMLESIYNAISNGWDKKRGEYANLHVNPEYEDLSLPDAFPKVVLCRLINTLEKVFTQSFQVSQVQNGDGSNPPGEDSWVVYTDSSSTQFEVKQNAGKGGVSCTCGRPQVTGLPCGHAVAVARHEQKSSRQFIHRGQSTAAYKEVISKVFSYEVPQLPPVEALQPDPNMLPPLSLDHPDIVVVTGFGRKKKRGCILSLPPALYELTKESPNRTLYEKLCTPAFIPPSRDHCSRCHLKGHHLNTCSTWGILPGLLFDNMNVRCGGDDPKTVLAVRTHRAKSSMVHPNATAHQQYHQEYIGHDQNGPVPPEQDDSQRRIMI